jgi:hypothetical protein
MLSYFPLKTRLKKLSSLTSRAKSVTFSPMMKTILRKGPNSFLQKRNNPTQRIRKKKPDNQLSPRKAI